MRAVDKAFVIFTIVFLMAAVVINRNPIEPVQNAETE